LPGDFEFFAKVHAGARTLLPVTERGVEDDDAIVFHDLLGVGRHGILKKEKPHRRVGQWGDFLEIQFNTRLPPCAAAEPDSEAVRC
jgi:hypothetical protein